MLSVEWLDFYNDNIIQPLYTGDKILKFCQEYNINIGKISLSKQNITAQFFNVFNVLMLTYIFCN